MLKRIIKKILNKNNNIKSSRSELELIKFAHEQYSLFTLLDDEKANFTSGIIFSMDRALQIHALLSSYLDHVENPVPLQVIYRASNLNHNEAYLEVFREFKDYVSVKRQEERVDFKEILIESISSCNSESIFFLVDDNLFVEPVELRSFSNLTSFLSVPSLRMGKNLTRSYMFQRNQPLPQFCNIRPKNKNSQLLAWIWKYSELDWNYPLSVDGHFFQRNEILTLVKSLDYDSPNRFEEQLQKFHMAFNWRIGICFEKSRIINIPFNRVQVDVENSHGAIHQDSMLKSWNDGFCIDRKFYYGVNNESAHLDLPLKLIKR